jgi:type IV pilus assembly protein PilO
MSMEEFVLKILQKPKSHQVGLWVGSLLLIVFLFWQFSIQSSIKQIDKVNSKIEGLEGQEQQKRKMLQEKTKLKKVIAELDERFSKALKELPESRDMDQFLSSISGLANDAGLEVLVFEPRPQVLKSFYAELPVRIDVRGTYHQVATFFDEVGRLDRIVNISGIGMKDAVVDKKKKKAELMASCTATTFRYLDEAERAVQAEVGKKKGRR